MSTPVDKPLRITVLAGGVGGAKMAEGLAFSRYGEQLSIIGNVADDQQFHGLWVSPDIDTLTYTLAGLIDPDKGWGLADESNRTLDALNRLGADTWMYLGDQDFATHIYRTEQRNRGVRPSEIASHIARRLGVTANIILPTDDCIQTRVKTDQGWLDFQDYFVREQCRPQVEQIAIEGIEQATATTETLQAIAEADLIVFAPSNPIVSIGAILDIPGIRQALVSSGAFKVAVSPLINGQTVKGPAGKMLTSAGYSCDHQGVADCYQGLIDALVIDTSDRDAAAGLRATGLAVLNIPTLMTTRRHKIDLAEALVEFFASNQAADDRALDCEVLMPKASSGG
ncbi:MAG: LPPG:FO 2-phospho-L-lactate transferase [Motiliproteus sp.]|jgi:LPPG:FO 2-phospho-L-lactate transferase